MARYLPPDHFCPWREEAEELRERLTRVEARVEELQRRVFGRTSERLPPVSKELREQRTDETARQAAQDKRRERAAARAALPSPQVHHPVPPEERTCPRCGGTDLKPLGGGKRSVLYEYVPARLERQVHVQQTLACACGEGIVTAPGGDKSQYGPGLVAHLVAAKCADSLPLHRLARALERQGVPMARSTLTDLFHLAAREVAPLADRLLERIAAQQVVQADETPLAVQAKGKTRKGYLWTFLADDEEQAPLIGYRFSPSRSGQTPVEVLGGTQGALVVDGHSGYNPVTTPKGRTRVGCWSHARRKFFKALPCAPEAQQAMDFIRGLYRVEHEALAAGIVRAPAHKAWRQEKSKPVLERFKTWLDEQAPLHPPKGPMGLAIGYALGQWEELCHFVEDERLPLDNNRSERALRTAAVGRKNFLFVGHDEAGGNLAGLYSLVATCLANEMNPETYLADVLTRVQSHPNSRLDELLPVAWKRLHTVNTS
ncbi:MAG TPA: IS66 family transposase [Archangium sp.]|nr:IS66 family transposase [Archangium sp.]